MTISEIDSMLTLASLAAEDETDEALLARCGPRDFTAADALWICGIALAAYERTIKQEIERRLASPGQTGGHDATDRI